jgi:hypothetical protein
LGGNAVMNRTLNERKCLGQFFWDDLPGFLRGVLTMIEKLGILQKMALKFLSFIKARLPDIFSV